MPIQLPLYQNVFRWLLELLTGGNRRSPVVIDEPVVHRPIIKPKPLPGPPEGSNEAIKETKMHILVDRYLSDDDSTLSKISINGVYQCDGCEDEYRKVKKVGETRIPAGTYKVGVRTKYGFHEQYSKKFPAFHKGMLHVLDVPGFTSILIHIGNYHTDTEGCLLVGTADEDAMAVWVSKNAYRNFYKKVIDAALSGDLTIEYQDNDLHIS